MSPAHAHHQVAEALFQAIKAEVERLDSHDGASKPAVLEQLAHAYSLVAEHHGESDKKRGPVYT